MQVTGGTEAGTGTMTTTDGSTMTADCTTVGTGITGMTTSNEGQQESWFSATCSGPQVGQNSDSGRIAARRMADFLP